MEQHVLETLDAALIGERLAEARRQRDLTQQQAADVLGVARTTLVAIEKGDRRPRATELVALARLYGSTVGDLVREAPSPAPPDFILQFRATRNGTGTGFDAKRQQDVRSFEELCRWYVELELLFDAPLPRRYPNPYDIALTPPERAGEEVASSERNRLGLGDGPIGDLWGILETDVGLRLFAIPMKDGRVAGMFFYSEEYGGCIAVNANQPAERRRRSAAHEYAHFLTDRVRAEITVLSGGKRLPESERFADAFARHFLMPGLGLQRRFESIRRSKNNPVTAADVLSLSHLYRVPFQAMSWRLEELKLLPAGTWETLRERGFRANQARQLIGLESNDKEFTTLPRRYEALAVDAYQKGQLTEGELAERLRTDRVGARERVAKLTTQQEGSESGEWSQIQIDLSAPLVGMA